jgi:hypothetical protein
MLDSFEHNAGSSGLALCCQNYIFQSRVFDITRSNLYSATIYRWLTFFLYSYEEPLLENEQASIGNLEFKAQLQEIT